MKSIVAYLVEWEDIGVHINTDSWQQGFDRYQLRHDYIQRYAIKRLRNGQVVSAHIPWSERIARTVHKVTSRRRIKHLLIYRDPRDAVVSNMN